MLPVLILGGAALAALAAPRMAAGVAMANHALGGLKAKEEAKVLKKAAEAHLDPSKAGNLTRMTIQAEGLPPEWSPIAGEYLLTDEEKAVFLLITAALSGEAQMPDLDPKQILLTYRKRTEARKQSGLLG